MPKHCYISGQRMMNMNFHSQNAFELFLSQCPSAEQWCLNLKNDEYEFPQLKCI